MWVRQEETLADYSDPHVNRPFGAGLLATRKRDRLLALERQVPEDGLGADIGFPNMVRFGFPLGQPRTYCEGFALRARIQDPRSRIRRILDLARTDMSLNYIRTIRAGIG